MNVLWTKNKNVNQIYSQVTVTLNAHASGDGGGAPGRCCRLCSGDTSLRFFGDSYVWEGVEERYDQLLYDCFGVRVTPSDCMICELCVRQLRNAERFRALVHAAFNKPPSGASTKTHTPVQKSSSSKLLIGVKSLKPDKEMIGLLKSRICEPRRKREFRKNIIISDGCGKRINIPCEICRQRYPMIIPTDGFKKFVCSRCKKNGEVRCAVCRKCNVGMPPSMMKEHMELHAKADLRAKTRLRQTNKTQKRVSSALKERAPCMFECSLCPKKYAVAKNLLTHVRSAHCDSTDTLCRACGQKFESRAILEEHLCSHSWLARGACRSHANRHKFHSSTT